jgi:YVTN family beta-propeller protein
MKINKKLHSVALSSAVLIIFLIIVSSAASAATEQSASSVVPHAYIANHGDGTVSVIDTATNKVTATVDVGSGPDGVAVTPDGTKVYVTNSYYDNVSVIDTATNKVTATIPVGRYPEGVAVTPDGTKVYVTNSYDDNVSVIDTATNKVIATIPVGRYPEGVAVTPDGTKVYVANSGNNDYTGNTVSVIDTATNKVVAKIYAGKYPYGIAVNPAGTKVYVTNHNCLKVSVIDTATNKVIATVPVGEYPYGIAVNPAGTKVYVANIGSETVSVIDAATNKVIATVPLGVGWGLNEVAVTPDGTKVYVTSGNVSIINTDTNTVIASVNVGNNPYSVAFSTASKSVLPAANFSANPTFGKAPLTVAFTDKSTGSPTKWKWTFGDGTNSTIQNPTHMYSKAGNYTVSLSATNAAGSNTTTKINYIKVTAVTKPVASFSSNVTSGKVPLNVAFTDKSSGTPTSWKWTFGDGTTSVIKNPTHIYSKAGKYTVSLTATNSAGSNTATKSSYISGVAVPVAAFSVSPTTGKAPLTVKFKDKSTGSPTSWSWNFGDKSTSTAQNPTHKYTKAGKYTVKLTVKNTAGSNTKTVSNYITVK